MSYFSNEALNQSVEFLDPTSPSQVYDKINEELGSSDSVITKFVSLKYPEIVYPASRNLAGKNVNRRTQFECKFWKDSRTDRNLVNSSTNSQGIHSGTFVVDSASFGGVGTDDDITYLTCFSQSMWPLDARINFETADTAYNWVTTMGTSSNNTCGNTGSFYPHYIAGEGELQSPAPQLHGQMKLNEVGAGYFNVSRPLFPGLQYHRRQTLPMSASTMAFSGYARGIDILGGTIPAISGWTANTSSISRIFGGDTKWEAGEQAGKNPFYYKDYNHYREDMKGKSLGYSLLPEFRISELMRKYITELDENFLSSDVNLFSLTGSELENSGDTDFYKVYSHSDFMKYFDVFESEQDASEITLKCKAKIKFIPYDGFYPVNRTVQLGTIFSQSYGKYVSNVKDLSDYVPTSAAPLSASATGSAQMNNLQLNVWNTFLQPFMKPGILFNMIKSGIAVDYPIFTGPFKTIDLTGTLGPNSAPVPYTGSYINELFFDKRIPFEALLNPELYMKDIHISNMEPHPSASTDTTASWTGQGDDCYKYAMNNFLAEVPEFFLRGNNLTTFVSKPENQFAGTTAGKTYSALVKLRKSLKDDSPSISNYYDGYRLDPAALLTPLARSPETITMYSRPTAFGPPSTANAPSGSVAGGTHPNLFGSDWGGSNMGYNAPFTPGYYDGAAWALLSFRATENKKYTIQEIHDNLEVDYIRNITIYNANPEASFSLVDLGRFLNASPNQSLMVLDEVFGYPADVTCSDITKQMTIDWINGIDNYITGSTEKYYNLLSGPQYGSVTFLSHSNPDTSAPASLQALYQVCPSGSLDVYNANAMQVSASINLKQKAEIPATIYNAISGKPQQIDGDPTKAVNVWAIQSKFETPILNFIDADITLPTFGSESCAKGMWHQHGRLPSLDEGIYLDLLDIPSELYSLLGYNSTSTGSLIDLVGFTPGQRKLGQVAETKEISEAVVAVPFIYKGNEKRFFKLDKTKVRDYVTEVENKVVPEKNSVSDMVTSMGNYVFPPTMDFYTNEEIDPFAMYIFEFKHTLTQQDLADIWQNLPPDIGTTFEEKETTISHSLLTDELLSRDSMREGNVRWMVFKVKKRAQKDYFSKIYGSDTKASQKSYPTPRMKELEGKNIQSKKNIPDYSYNWPYDFFSLVELAQIESEVEFKEEED